MTAHQQMLLLRMRLLLVCYIVSAVGAAIAVGLMREVVLFDAGRLWAAAIPSIGIMTLTGSAQWWFNERFLQPLTICFEELGDAAKLPADKVQGGIAVRLLIFSGIIAGVIGLLFFVHFGKEHLRDFPLARLAIICALLPATAGMGWIWLSRHRTTALQRKESSPANALRAALFFPMRASLASFLLWCFAAAALPISFYFYVGFSIRTCFYFGLLAFGAALIALPTQYFLFKKELDPFVTRLLELDPDSLLHQQTVLPLRYKFFATALGLVFFGVVFSTVRSFAGMEQILIESAAGRVRDHLSVFRERIELEGAPSEELLSTLRREEVFFLPEEGPAQGASMATLEEAGISARSIREQMAGRDNLELALRAGWSEGHVILKRAGPGILGAVAMPETESLPKLLAPAFETFVAVILIGFFLSLFFSRDISQTIKGLGRHADDLAQGVLNTPLRVASDDEHGQLARLLRSTSERLEELVIQVKSLSEHVAQAAAQLQIQSAELSEGSASQNEQAEAANTRMDLMSQTLREQGSGAKETLEQATHMREAAEIGHEAVGVSAAGMKRIQQVSEESRVTVEALSQGAQRIGQITEAISEIAAQTNMLALNASIEASRAGEHGRGFGVVAEEIRKLAERASDAAHEIDSTLRNIGEETSSALQVNRRVVDEIGHGIERELQTQQAFRSMEESIEAAERLVRRAAEMTQEQSSHGEEVQGLVGRVLQITRDQQGSAAIIAETAKDLSERAEALRLLLSKFRT
ncbi:MAG: methyl-accepting chemotaxis protein [Bdellovibrionota bacterium]